MLTLAAALVGLIGCQPPKPANLLLITIDTLRADRLGCYGYPRPTSPAIDRLAAESVLFEHAVTTMATMVPTSLTSNRVPIRSCGSTCSGSSVIPRST